MVGRRVAQVSRECQKQGLESLIFILFEQKSSVKIREKNDDLALDSHSCGCLQSVSCFALYFFVCRFLVALRSFIYTFIHLFTNSFTKFFSLRLLHSYCIHTFQNFRNSFVCAIILHPPLLLFIYFHSSPLLTPSIFHVSSQCKTALLFTIIYK